MTGDLHPSGDHGPCAPEVLEFLRCPTPDAWFEQAPAHLETLLVDHAHCEKKAASTALAMLYRYVDRPELLYRMSRLAREELRHFEQVHQLMARRGIRYRHLTPSRYAGGLMGHVRTGEPHRLVDTLLVGAIVEARSCERFAGLSRVLGCTGACAEVSAEGSADGSAGQAQWSELADLYRGLVASEARHFRHYLQLARRYGDGEVEARLDVLLGVDAELITTPDTAFRFHSGPLP